MKRYRDVFFDLDHTLWDFRGNSRETLHELYDQLGLERIGVPDAVSLVEVYEEINADLWRVYALGRIHPDVLRVLRFRNSLQRFGVRDDRMARRLSQEYMERCPRKSRLLPGAREVLDRLAVDHKLHIITNGFEATQHLKLRSSGIDHLFSVVQTSEQAGARKPSPVIFEKALERAGAGAGASIMVGDDVDADMRGARHAGLDHVHVVGEGAEPDPDATHRVRHLAELMGILS